MQGKRRRVLDSRGRPVKGLYMRDGVFIAGFNCPQQPGKWRMENLNAKTLTDAKRERDSLLAALREERTSTPVSVTFEQMFREHQATRHLAERTVAHEQHLLDRHLATIKSRRVQSVTTAEVARLLRDMRDGTKARPKKYSSWTRYAVYRILKGTFDLAVQRGIVNRSPVAGLAKSEIPKQKNDKEIARLDAASLEHFVKSGKTERWRAALALGGIAGERLGEIRALHWSEVDFEADTITVLWSMRPEGTEKLPKTEAGVRVIPMLPFLRRLLIEWKLKSLNTAPSDLVICTADGKPVQERNLRRAFDGAKDMANIDVGDARLSWHALRHSYASMMATDLAVEPTTLARVTGHSDPSFTYKKYARDARPDAVVVADVLNRAKQAGIGG